MPGPPYGLTNTGFVSATVDDIETSIVADELALIDPLLDTSADEPIGQVNGIVAEALAEAYELLATAYSAYDDTQAEGSLLDSLCALTGVVRKLDAPGTCVVNCTFSGAGVALSTTAKVALDTDATNTWTLQTAYTSIGAGVVPLTFVSTRNGPFPAPVGHLTTIVTAVAGWTAATNPNAATEGTFLESDTALRTRRRAEIKANGSANLPAMQALLFAVAGVIQVLVLENTGLLPDANGQPGKSIQALIWDGTTPAASNASLASVLFANKAAGIQTFGTTAVTIEDSTGTSRVVSFSRVPQIVVNFTLTVLVDHTKFPLDGVAQIKNFIKLGFSFVTIGQEIVRLRAMGAALLVAGVIDVTACLLNGVADNVIIPPLSIGICGTLGVTVTP